MHHYGLILQSLGGILFLDKRGTAGGCASDIELHGERGKHGIRMRSLPL
jgi:hypothetical protein